MTDDKKAAAEDAAELFEDLNKGCEDVPNWLLGLCCLVMLSYPAAIIWSVL